MSQIVSIYEYGLNDQELEILKSLRQAVRAEIFGIKRAHPGINAFDLFLDDLAVDLTGGFRISEDIFRCIVHELQVDGWKVKVIYEPIHLIQAANTGDIEPL